MATLERIEIQNFKTFRGKTVINDLKHFMCVIGPNGSGKSNFMDAISFVMGDKTSSLRVTRLKDLIHGASVKRPFANRASVTAVFKRPDSSRIAFTRIINDSASEYKIDGKPVFCSKYVEELKYLGINVKAKNFLVFQGTVESLALKSSKDRTALFEEFCGSSEYQEEYENLKSKMLEVQNDYSKAACNKKIMLGMKRDAMKENKAAEEYQRLKKEMEKTALQFYLLQLYVIQKAIEELDVEAKEKSTELNKKKDILDKAKKKSGKSKKSRSTLDLEVNKLQEQVCEVENKIRNICSSLIQAETKLTHSKDKIENASLDLKNAQETHRAQQMTVNTLKTNLIKVKEEEQLAYKAKKSDYREVGTDLQLTDLQVKMYDTLRKEVSKRSAFLDAQLDSLNRENELYRDCLDMECHKKHDLELKLKFTKDMIDLKKSYKAKLSTELSNITAKLEEQETLHQQITSKKNQIVELQYKLDECLEEKQTIIEEENQKKKAKVEMFLKNQVPGVFGRLGNITKPIHEKYKKAIREVMKESLDAIVVNNEKTAKECVQFVKGNGWKQETFLPLNILKVETPKQHLTTSQDPPNINFLHDVIVYSSEIKRAVLFATKGALVCETTEDAEKIAYDETSVMDKNLSVVSLDGIYIQKFGVVSRGTDEKKVSSTKTLSQLKNDCKEISEEICSIYHFLRNAADETYLIETYLSKQKYVKDNLRDIDKHLQELHHSANQQEKHIANIKSHLKEQEIMINTQISNLKKLKLEREHIEDTIFKDFCAQIGVQNIRDFESQGFNHAKELEALQVEFEQKKHNIQNQLNYECMKANDLLENIIPALMKKVKHSQQNDMESLSLTVKEKKKNLQHAENDLVSYQAALTSAKEKVVQHNETVTLSEERVTEILKERHALEKHLSSLEQRAYKLKATRHEIFEQSKIDNVDIPKKASAAHDQLNSSSSTSTDDSRDTQAIYESESRIIINFSELKMEYRTLQSQAEFQREIDGLQKALQEIKNKLHVHPFPNLKAPKSLPLIDKQLHNAAEELKDLKNKLREARENFETVKKKRFDCFMKCFDTVSNNIDETYKLLTRSNSGIALLTAENAEEPYLDGISYCCIVPGKTCQPMQSLSGGERTLAAVALLLAMHSFRPSPFFILDEIDAALDNRNVSRVTRFFQENTSLQTIMISHKDELFCHADGLIGITSEARECLVSQVLTFDLSQLSD